MPEFRFDPLLSVLNFERRGSSQLPVISGYAAVWYRDGEPDTEYQLDKNVFERIDSHAFDDAIRNDNCRALVNHNPDLLLGTTKSGTLALSVDGIGLRYRITPVDTAAARDLVTNLEAGAITGSSFSFNIDGADGEDWYTDDNGRIVRIVRSVTLYDVSPVTFPAYDATTCGIEGSARNLPLPARPRSATVPRSTVIAKGAEIERFLAEHARQPARAWTEKEKDRQARRIAKDLAGAHGAKPPKSKEAKRRKRLRRQMDAFRRWGIGED